MCSLLLVVYQHLQYVLACACVCMHVFSVWLHKPGESRELSEGGCPGFLSKKDEGCAGDATCLTVAEKKITIKKKKAPKTSELQQQEPK